ncbi:FtsX-like permease family protein [Gammaproteobacteria bacterium]|nr:FtsX-like permease family protein [Gammaproteobacteria bacterium]
MQRNKSRTWLTAGGIGFSVLLVSFAMSMQSGSYEIMIDSATRYFSGYGQVSDASYIDQPRFERTVPNATALQAELETIDGLSVMPRVQAFAVVSMGEKSLGGMVMGVDFAAETRFLDIYDNVIEGQIPRASDEALIGSSMARNLGARVGDELIVLGSGKQGAVAAAIFIIAGIVETGQVELDRTLVFAPIAGVADAFYLQDEVHMLLLMVENLSQLGAIGAQIETKLTGPLALQTWQELMPMIEQSIELDKAGAQLFYSLLLILVVFAVVNTFVMVLFERTREFGLFMALGMRPWQVIGQVQFEALLLSLLGVGLGLALGLPLINYLSAVGIPLEHMGGEEAARQMQMGSFDRLFPKATLASLLTAPMVMIVGTQLAALVSTVRVRGIHPVSALRVE